MPKVSIVIPTCNRPHLIKRAIDSVLNQTYKDFEIIVVDDGDQKVKDLVDSIQDERVKYLNSGIKLGAPVARNKGIKNSKGEYVALLDDDDEWMPEKLEKQVKALDSCDYSVVMVFCGFEMCDKDGRLFDIRLPGQSGVIWPFKQILHRSYIWTSTIMIRKSAMIKNNILFDEELKKNQEWDLQLRLLKGGKFYAINEALVKLNVLGEEDHMGGKKNIKVIISATELFIKKHYLDYKKNKKSLAFCYLRLGILYRDNHQLKEARATILKALFANPWNFMYYYYALNAVLLSILGERVYFCLRGFFTRNK